MSSKAPILKYIDSLPDFLERSEYPRLAEHCIFGNRKGVIEYFNGMPEETRREHFSFCEKCYEYFRSVFYRLPDDPEIVNDRIRTKCLLDSLHAAENAVYATADWGRIQQMTMFPHNIYEDLDAILRSRKPDWTLSLVERIAELRIGGTMVDWTRNHWSLYRSYVQEGIVESSSAEVMTLLLFNAFADPGRPGETEPPIMQRMQLDPDLLSSEIWSIFQISEYPENWSYTSHDKQGAWNTFFCELAASNPDDRHRIVEGCFQALKNDLTDHQTRWFVQLLILFQKNQLLGDDEIRRTGRLDELLHHSLPTPRSFGLAVFERLFKAGLTDERELLDRSRQLLREGTKSKAKKALGFLKKQLSLKNTAQKTTARQEIFQLLLSGLSNENVEIQESSLDLLSKHGALDDSAIRESVHGLVDSLAPSVQKLLSEKIKSFTGHSSVRKTMTVRKTSDSIRSAFVPRLPEPLVPVQSENELLDLAIQLLRDPSDPDEIERWLDGVSRFGVATEMMSKRKGRSLLKRFCDFLGTDEVTFSDGKRTLFTDMPISFSGRSIGMDCRYMIAAWLTGTIPRFTIRPIEISTVGESREESFRLSYAGGTLEFAGRTWRGYHPNVPEWECPVNLLFSVHAEAIADRIVRNETRRLLCTPTHRDGWIEPKTFADRLVEDDKKGIRHSDQERILALLRLWPKGREEALEVIEKSIPNGDEYIDAACYALGKTNVKPGNTASYWIAAARSRTPTNEDSIIDEKFPGLGLTGGKQCVAIYDGKTRFSELGRRCFMPEEYGNDWTLFPTVSLNEPVDISRYECQPTILGA